MNGFCPSHEARVLKSQQNCENTRNLKETIEHDLWPEINKRAKTTILMSCLAVGIAILSGSFTVLYEQGNNLSNKIEKIGETLETRISCLEKNQSALEANQKVLMRRMK